MNKGSSLNDKLNQCCAAFERWVVFEPGMSLTSSHDLLTVAKHTTFGRLKAQVLMSSCICPDAWKGSVVKPNPQCALHAEEVSLTDVLFEIIQVVHDVFPDDFMCFAHLITSRTVGRRVYRKMFFFSHKLFLFIDCSSSQPVLCIFQKFIVFIGLNLNYLSCVFCVAVIITIMIMIMIIIIIIIIIIIWTPV